MASLNDRISGATGSFGMPDERLITPQTLRREQKQKFYNYLDKSNIMSMVMMGTNPINLTRAPILARKKFGNDFGNYVKSVQDNFIKGKPRLLKRLKSADKNIIDLELGGSFGRGVATPQSDIDYMIVYKGKKALEDVARKFRPLVTNNGLVDIVVRSKK